MGMCPLSLPQTRPTNRIPDTGALDPRWLRCLHEPHGTDQHHPRWRDDHTHSSLRTHSPAMMRIDDLLLQDYTLRRLTAKPEMDPLTEVGALQEAQLLGLKFDAVSGVAGLLFELRMALQLRETNTS